MWQNDVVNDGSMRNKAMIMFGIGTFSNSFSQTEDPHLHV